MERKELIQLVAQKLDVPEELVDEIYMHQASLVRESLHHPDRTEIYMPNLGTYKLHIGKAAQQYLKDMNFGEFFLRKEDTRLLGRAEDCFYRGEILGLKIGYLNDKYEGIRKREDDIILKGFEKGDFIKTVDKLREERNANKEDLGE